MQSRMKLSADKPMDGNVKLDETSKKLKLAAARHGSGLCNEAIERRVEAYAQGRPLDDDELRRGPVIRSGTG